MLEECEVEGTDNSEWAGCSEEGAVAARGRSALHWQILPVVWPD